MLSEQHQNQSIFDYSIELDAEKTDAFNHMNFLNGEIDDKSWVILAKNEQAEKDWKQYRIKPATMNDTETEQYLEQFNNESDTYMSMNTFYIPKRQAQHARKLRSLYVDIDCYTVGLTPEQALYKADKEVFQKGILPLPNYYTFSGQGLYFVWLIDPMPYKASDMKVFKLWKAVLNHFFSVFQSLKVGADPVCVDASRVLRLAGTKHSKTNKTVKNYYVHEHQYNVGNELLGKYLPPFKFKERKQQTKKHNTKKVKPLLTQHSLFYSRMKDLEKLTEIRQGDMKGYREYACFIYRYNACLFTDDTEKALQMTLELNQMFSKPLTDNEVISATQSAEQGYFKRLAFEQGKESEEMKAWLKAYRGVYKRPGYNYSNKRLIKLFEITADEQKHLDSIISSEEKKHRKMLANREIRGSVSRDEYKQQQQEKTDDKLWLLQRALERYPDATKVELAKKLGIGRTRLYELLKQL